MPHQLLAHQPVRTAKSNGRHRFTPEIEVATITPRMAEKMLEHNHANRKIRKTVVAKYALDMANDRWRLKGQTPILLDRQGNLVNGQHRLAACVQSGASFQTYIIHNAEAEDVDMADSGLNRTLGDVLGWRGEANPNKLAQVVRIAWLYETGRLDAIKLSASPTRAEAVEWLRDHPGIQESLEAVQDLHLKLRMPMGVAAMVHYYASKHHPNEVIEFFDGLRHGANLSEGSPILALRNRLADRLLPHGSLRVMYLLAVTIKAFNAYVEGKEMENARWRMRGPAREPFPRLVGEEK
jgi:hypothetical protein